MMRTIGHQCTSASRPCSFHIGTPHERFGEIQLQDESITTR